MNHHKEGKLRDTYFRGVFVLAYTWLRGRTDGNTVSILQLFITAKVSWGPASPQPSSYTR